MTRFGLVVVGALAALTACVGARPPLPAESRVQPPDTWRAATPAGAGPVPSAWWQSFGDPTLTALVDEALRRNDDVRVALARVAEARAALRVAHAALLPSVTAAAPGERAAGVSPFGLADQETDGGFEVAIAYDVDLFGRLRSEQAAAAADYRGTAATRDAVRLAIAATAATAYITLCALDARLQIAESTLALRADSLRVASRRYASGYSTALDLRQAETEYLATQALIPELQRAITTEENAFSALLSRPPGAIVRGQRLDALQAPDLPDALPSTVVRQRPDLYAAEQRLVATDRSLDAARAALLPDISLEAGAGRAFSTLFPEPITIWSVGGSILAPLFEGGALHAKADIAAARRDQAAFAYRRTVLTAFREVEDQLTTVRRSAEELQILTAQQDAFAAAARLATRRYRTGYSSYLEQIDSERGLLNAQLAVVQVTATHLVAYVDLFRALGGNWQRPADASAQMQMTVGSSK